MHAQRQNEEVLTWRSQVLSTDGYSPQRAERGSGDAATTVPQSKITRKIGCTKGATRLSKDVYIKQGELYNSKRRRVS